MIRIKPNVKTEKYNLYTINFRMFITLILRIESGKISISKNEGCISKQYWAENIKYNFKNIELSTSMDGLPEDLKTNNRSRGILNI